jgi:cellulose synthase/poly-beta-1,6-N-acetylglucosamine synthase-like glycosyltransferase
MIPLPPQTADLVAAGLRLVYFLVLCGLALYGGLGLYTLFLFRRMRRQVHFRPEAAPPPPRPDDWPTVTVQLPIYNERYVVERLVTAAVNLDYPRGRLEIQVIDDSNDDTRELTGRLVTRFREQGHDIRLVTRPERSGYKAGALAAALAQAQGEFIAVFDADFQPGPEFLRETIPHFLQDAQVGMVQARWGHLNPEESLLTAAQAIALDKHFAIEQTVRSEADLFPKFNGTAGVWRRSCIEAAGGWQADTLCEDLCLSTRAVLGGWRLRFLPHVVAAAELPASILAYKNQQSRWAQGSTQCLLKFGPAIWRSSQRRAARLYALLTMSAYATSMLLLLLLLLQLPMLLLDVRPETWWIVFGIFGLGQPALFLYSQRLLYPGWQRRLRSLPALLLVAVGLSVTLSQAVLRAVTGRQRAFVRTPKQGQGGAVRPYRLPLSMGTFIELLLAAYAAGGIALALARGNWGPLFFFATCLVGFGYVGWQGLREGWPGRKIALAHGEPEKRKV